MFLESKEEILKRKKRTDPAGNTKGEKPGKPGDGAPEDLKSERDDAGKGREDASAVVREADEDPAPEDNKKEDPGDADVGEGEEDPPLGGEEDTEDDENAGDDLDTGLDDAEDDEADAHANSKKDAVESVKKYRLIEFYKELLKLCRTLRSDMASMADTVPDDQSRKIVLQYAKYVDNTIEKIEFVLEHYAKRFRYPKLLMVFVQLKTTIDMIVETIGKIAPKG